MKKLELSWRERGRDLQQTWTILLNNNVKRI